MQMPWPQMLNTGSVGNYIIFFLRPQSGPIDVIVWHQITGLFSPVFADRPAAEAWISAQPGP